MDYTKFLKLSKPSYADDVDIQVINNNMDILDGKIGDLPFLPLKGGIVTGQIKFNNTNIYFTNGTSKYDGMIRVGANGNFDIGANYNRDTGYATPNLMLHSFNKPKWYNSINGGKELLADYGTNTGLNGYTKLSNGLIIQWGTVETNENTGYGDVGVVTLLQPMATSAYVTYITKSYGTGDGLDTSWDWRCATMNITTTGFKIRLDGHDTSRQMHWLVIGKGV